MNNEVLYNIKIGELYIWDICTSNNNPETIFIESIHLNAIYGEKYTAEKVMSLRRILLELGICEESITVETIKGE